MACNSCGTPTIIYNPPCENCLAAPKVIWGCDQGPSPGETMTFNIAEIANLKLPTPGNYTFDLFRFDVAGFNSVFIDSNGDVTAQTKLVYDGRKKYFIYYKIRKTGSVESVTGVLEICFKNDCKSCIGVCDPLVGSCLYATGKTINNATCQNTYTFDLSDWVGWEYADAEALKYEWIGMDSNITATFTNPPLSPGSGNAFMLNIQTNSNLLPGTYNWELKIWNAGISYTVPFSLVFPDRCLGINCGPGMLCNPCTGICEDVTGNVSVDSTSTGVSGSGNVIVE